MWATNLLSKVAQLFANFVGIFWKSSLCHYLKTALASFNVTLWKYLLGYILIPTSGLTGHLFLYLSSEAKILNEKKFSAGPRLKNDFALAQVPFYYLLTSMLLLHVLSGFKSFSTCAHRHRRRWWWWWWLVSLWKSQSPISLKFVFKVDQLQC